jgi:heme exporter protein A
VRGDRRLFHDLDFALAAGELGYVAGPNGSGKTSLLRILCGLAWPAAGEVLWDGAAVRSQREEYNAQLLYLGHANAVKDELTPIENLRLGAALAGHKVDGPAARDALQRFGLARVLHLPARYLSQGQRRRVALARLLLEPAAPLWIIDEPFNALDAAAVRDVEDVLAAQLARGGIVVITTHQETPILARAAARIDVESAA